MLANYEVEMLTGKRGQDGEIAASEIIRREEVAERKKERRGEREKERRLGVSTLIGMLSFCLRTLSLLRKNMDNLCIKL